MVTSSGLRFKPACVLQSFALPPNSQTIPASSKTCKQIHKLPRTTGQTASFSGPQPFLAPGTSFMKTIFPRVGEGRWEW